MFKKSLVLKLIRNEMCVNGAKIGVAQRRAGLRSVSTLHLWRKRPLIERYILACIERCKETRNDIVEDAFFKRLAVGRGNAADYEFYLTNRMPDKWKKNNVVKVEGGETRIILINPKEKIRADQPEAVSI